MTITTQYDICYDDYSNEWEAVGALFTDAAVDARGIRVTYKGIAPHGWPIMELKVPSEETARRVTAAYLAVYNLYDEEVTDYLFGRLVATA